MRRLWGACFGTIVLLFGWMKVNDQCSVLFWCTTSTAVGLVPQYCGAVVLPSQWLWNFLWWTNCTALSQCMCVCVCVCEIFASLLAQLTLLRCRNARISDSFLLNICPTLWKHFGLSAFCTSTFVARWCFCYSLPRALSRLCLALQALGVNGWLRNE